ncbi:MAG: Lon protease family protein [Candidatus Thorarchaeota archaeon]|jgi:lon-related putative ATP-dependent protease
MIMMVKELSFNEIRASVDADTLPAMRTERISPLDDVIGQERALKALSFGLGIGEKGFNIYTAGESGTGKTTTVKAYLEESAMSKPPSSDWCYVYNFKEPSEPNAIELPKGSAEGFKKDIGELIENAGKVLPEVFQSEDYASRRDAAIRAAEEVRNKLFSELNQVAEKKGLSLQRSPSGLLIVPIVEGQPLSDQDVAALSPEEIEKITQAREELSSDLRNAMRSLRDIDNQVRTEIEKLSREAALFAIDHYVSDLKEKYSEVSEVAEYIETVQNDILDNLAMFILDPNVPQNSPEAVAAQERFFKKYEVNVLVDNSLLTGAPVIVELNPTYLNLFGKTEKEARFGVLTTDFTMIKPGSLHKANGGYLMIPAQELLTAPLAWDGLKRALKNDEIVIEDATQAQGVISTRGLKPEAIPLKVKVVIIGDTAIYNLLYTRDPDFKELFKVKAHFDSKMERTEETISKYVSAMRNVCSKEGLKYLDQDAAAKVVEFSSRLADDQTKLSTRFADVTDIIREATYYAKKEDSENVTGAHMKKAIDEKKYRSNLVQDKIQEMIDRGVILIDTEGEQVGQLNGLSVLSYGDIAFGSPTRITASVGVGRKGILDIEREANLGGPTHTKGVMILGGYLSKMFAQDKPLGLSARLVFEQSYSGVDGDSASSTELYAILSQLSGIPIRQQYAVTGSVNQNGEVQAIGGVNEKIEGFFEVCRISGLTGDQGVLIPESNVRNLMLKEEVVEAVKAGKFHIFSVRTVNEGIEILTGVKAGERQPDGTFPEDTINYRVDKRLKEMAEALKEYPGYI